MRSRRLLVVLAITLLVALPACAEPEPQIVEVTREVDVPQTVEVTREVTKIVQETVEVTRIEQVVLTATPTPTPVDTPTPTNTPTVTPTPTQTPRPTATPGFGAAESQYVRESGQIVGAYVTWVNAYLDHTGLAVDDTSLLDNEAWVDELTEILAHLESANEDARELDCPPRCETAHSKLLEAVDHFETLVTAYPATIYEVRIGQLIQAMDELEPGMNALQEFEDRRLELADQLP
jgi:hypothetical protein